MPAKSSVYQMNNPVLFRINNPPPIFLQYHSENAIIRILSSEIDTTRIQRV